VLGRRCGRMDGTTTTELGTASDTGSTYTKVGRNACAFGTAPIGRGAGSMQLSGVRPPV